MGALHQSMHHFVANSPWSDRAVLAVARDWALPALERHGVVAAWVAGLSCHEKKGKASVGVARQVCGVGSRRRGLAQAGVPDDVGYSVRVPDTYELTDLVHLATLGWRVERDFGDMRDMLGLLHYEGRGWRGFHHHGSLCCAAFAFLAARRAELTPPMPLTFLQPLLLPPGFSPRGSPGSGCSRMF